MKEQVEILKKVEAEKEENDKENMEPKKIN